MTKIALTDAVLDLILTHPDAMTCAANDADLALALLRRAREAVTAPNVAPAPGPIATPSEPAARFYRGRMAGRFNAAMIGDRRRYRSDHYTRTAARIGAGIVQEESLPMGDGSTKRFRVVYLTPAELGEVRAAIAQESAASVSR